jgi:peptide/nickel transport system substrate-binding protein
MNARPLTAVLLCVALAGCGGAPERDRNVVVVAVRTPPNNLDPRQANDETSQRVGQLIFSCLMDVGPDLRVVPRLALRLDNPDPLTYVAHLRRGVKFHDGHEMTSKDVVYTYAAFLEPDYISPFKGAFRVLESVRALDDYTVEFRLKEPFGAFPAQLAGVPPIVPAGSGDTMRTFPIGTGPYRFVSAGDDVVTLSAFEGYFDGLPNNAGIVLKVVPDDTMRGLELRKGSVDVVVNDLPPDMVHQLESGDHFRVQRDPGLDFSYIGVNMRDPVLKDKRVRHAIGYAIDRDAIVKYLRRGLARPAIGLVPPQAWAFEPAVHAFTFDPARARTLLDEAGYRDPDGEGPRPRLRLSLKISTNEETRLQSTVIQQDLRRVGIDLDVRSYEFASFYADVLKGDFQLFSLQWVGGALADPDILRRVFHSQQVPPAGFNRGYYSNPEVDRLIDTASRASTDEERRANYAQAQRIIAEDAPYIPIWNKVNVILAQPGYAGLHLPLTGDFQALKDVRWAPPGAVPSDALPLAPAVTTPPR